MASGRALRSQPADGLPRAACTHYKGNYAMVYSRRAVLAAVLLLPLGVPANAQVIVDYAEPPASTEAELFSKAVVVLRGRVEDRRMESGAGPTTSVYTMQILELLKDSGQHSVGGRIEVHRHGGFDARTRNLDFPPFEVGDEVVVFLERGNNGWYWPRNGPDSAFKLTTDGRVHAYGHLGAVSKRHAGRRVSEFMAELRKHVN